MNYNEFTERGIKSKSFIRKDVFGGNYVDFPYEHGRIVKYAIDNNIKYDQKKYSQDSKTNFITELIFDSEEQARIFYEKMEEIIEVKPFHLR